MLVAAADDGGLEKYTEQFRSITNEIATLKKCREQIQEQRQQNTAAVHRINNAMEVLETASPEWGKWDESLIRQLITSVKVLGEDKILVCFKGGFEVPMKLYS
ncbi:MAG: hypothetical protein VB100_09545 [Angelakisella sp.]|nr:hypothetical protein [Angelakisella sp.]